MQQLPVVFKKLKISIIIAVIAMIFCANEITWAEGKKPILNQGRKWRIAYYEGGPFFTYAETMRTLIEELMHLGWLNKAVVSRYDEEVAAPYWDLLMNNNSNYFEFHKDHAYSAGWDKAKRKENRAAILAELKEGKIDLVIAMGTWAGQDLATDDHNVPVVVMSCSDPIGAEIIDSAEDSGRDHVTARVARDRYFRQLRMFHRLVGFKRLGVAFENTPDGRLYSAMREVEIVSKERNFDVITCEVLDTTADRAAADKSCLGCFEKLSLQSDAIYVTALSCAKSRGKELSELFVRRKIPSFAMSGGAFVEDGIMLALSQAAGLKAQAVFHAEKIVRILYGERPRSLNQILDDPLFIAINMGTAKKIGFQVPNSMLRIATEVYDENED